MRLSSLDNPYRVLFPEIWKYFSWKSKLSFSFLLTNIWDVGMCDVKLIEAPQHPQRWRQGQFVVEAAGAGTDDELAGVTRDSVQGEMVHIVSSTHYLMDTTRMFI